ncbi:MAG: hypothetical protein WCB12_14750 [Bryobacteraceae bacterium]
MRPFIVIQLHGFVMVDGEAPTNETRGRTQERTGKASPSVFMRSSSFRTQRSLTPIFRRLAAV